MADYYIMTFYSTHLAIKFEKIMKEACLSVKLVPVPRQVSSSCGIAGRFSKEDAKEIYEKCRESALEFESVYGIPANKKEKPVEIDLDFF